MDGSTASMRSAESAFTAKALPEGVRNRWLETAFGETSALHRYCATGAQLYDSECPTVATAEHKYILPLHVAFQVPLPFCVDIRDHVVLRRAPRVPGTHSL